LARLKTAGFTIPEDFETEFLNCTKLEIQRKYKSVCLIGNFGAGKSQSCNTLCGRDFFHPSNSFNSHSYETKGVFSHWFGDPNNEKIFILDTPGLVEWSERD
jgi:GTPase Era involved in 16S rRNA processing